MNVQSLRFRLLVVGVFSIGIALIASAAGLTYLFKRHLERRVYAELHVHINQLAAGLDRNDEGEITLLRPPGEPRFDRPLSGLYWQVAIERDGSVLRSRSLWDHELAVPSELGKYNNRLAGPGRAALYFAERRFILSPRLDRAAIRVVAGLDEDEIKEAIREFLKDLVPAVMGIGGLLLIAALAQVFVGLRPLGTVRERLADVSLGRAKRLGPARPEELQPLVMEIDALLDARDRQLDKARERSADLAHALKTPLQVLTGEAERLAKRGEVDIAREIANLASLMNRQVHRELARSRIAAGVSSASANVGAVAERVIAVVRRMPAGQRLDWIVDLPADLTARIDADDLAEALGNLIENAAIHATSRVEIAGSARQTGVVVTIRDDGPGIPIERMDEALSRGGRLDSMGTGTGLGLAIVSDIADAWGAVFAIENASPGLKANLMLSCP